MNKHLYYNDIKIILGDSKKETAHNQEIVNDQGRTNEKLKLAIQKFLSPENKKDLFVYTKNIQETFEAIKKEFYFIEAAGGLIQNKDRFLFIKRLGKWDLPKGKLDKGETIQEAAIRECEEECAVEGLNIIKQLHDSYHIYEYKKGFALKTTYWFQMDTESTKELKPQIEENIEEVKWFTIDEIKKIVLQNTYITIDNLVREFFKL